ncbi:ATP-binding protein [Flavobacteriaceae bacterium 3-367]|uniref:AAA family ATPase n=1 Tax=Eudoraea algarum TaxID=3417568 RepID=UPI00327F452C
MNTTRVVISGGPGTGKTSVIKMLEESGFFCFHEIIRSMTSNAKKEGNPEAFVSNPIVSVSNPAEFNEMILQGRIDQFKRLSEVKGRPAFYDRGIPDVLAYMDFFGQSYEDHFVSACKTHLYDTVFLLPPWKEIYVSDNERFESFEEAVQVHEHLERTYRRFGYDIVMVPLTNVEERLAFILNRLKLQ